MLTTELFIAIISLCITCFALGYAIKPLSCQTYIQLTQILLSEFIKLCR